MPSTRHSFMKARCVSESVARPTPIRRPARPLLAALIAGVAFASAIGTMPAVADDVLVFRAGDRIDPEAVARILSGETARPAGVRTRSLRLLDEPQARPGRPGGAATMATGSYPVLATASGATRRDESPSPTSANALSLPVPFAFDSAELLPDARQQLDAVAEGIKMTGQEQLVRIEGHTDALGSDEYNQSLSERRAASVKRYLVSVHRIAPQRLEVVGYGESAPLDGTPPNGSINRRVQFRGG